MTDEKQMSLEDYVSPYPDGLPGHSKGCDTSTAAAREIKVKATKLQQEVLDFLTRRGAYGATAFEVSEQTGIYLYTAMPRITELSKMGLIVDSGERRRTPHGKLAKVWRSA